MLPHFASNRTDYYRKNIYPFAVNLVESYIELNGFDRDISTNDFSESDIARFAAILLAEAPEEMGDVVWHEDVYSLLVAAIRTEDTEDKIIFAEKTIDDIIKHFEYEMNEILESIYNPHRDEHRAAIGLKFNTDSETGEGRWS